MGARGFLSHQWEVNQEQRQDVSHCSCSCHTGLHNPCWTRKHHCSHQTRLYPISFHRCMKISNGRGIGQIFDAKVLNWIYYSCCYSTANKRYDKGERPRFNFTKPIPFTPARFQRSTLLCAGYWNFFNCSIDCSQHNNRQTISLDKIADNRIFILAIVSSKLRIATTKRVRRQILN